MQFTSVRVGPFDVTIDHLEGKDRTDFLGTFSSGNMTISLRDQYVSEQVRAETLLHEILHAVYQVFDVKPKDGEERTVHGLSIGLACVIRDNPDLMAWMMGALR